MNSQDSGIFKNRLLTQKELDKLLANTGVSTYNRRSWSDKLLLVLQIPVVYTS